MVRAQESEEEIFEKGDKVRRLPVRKASIGDPTGKDEDCDNEEHTVDEQDMNKQDRSKEGSKEQVKNGMEAPTESTKEHTQEMK